MMKNRPDPPTGEPAWRHLTATIVDRKEARWRRIGRWVGSIVGSLVFSSAEVIAPPIAVQVSRRDTGRPIFFVPAYDYADGTEKLRELTADLKTMTVEEFAARWGPHSARSASTG